MSHFVFQDLEGCRRSVALHTLKGPCSTYISALEGGVPFQVASCKVSRYRGMSQLHCRLSRYSGPLSCRRARTLQTDNPSLTDSMCSDFLLAESWSWRAAFCGGWSSSNPWRGVGVLTLLTQTQGSNSSYSLTIERKGEGKGGATEQKLILNG